MVYCCIRSVCIRLPLSEPDIRLPSILCRAGALPAAAAAATAAAAAAAAAAVAAPALALSCVSDPYVGSWFPGMNASARWVKTDVPCQVRNCCNVAAVKQAYLWPGPQR